MSSFILFRTRGTNWHNTNKLWIWAELALKCYTRFDSDRDRRLRIIYWKLLHFVNWTMGRTKTFSSNTCQWYRNTLLFVVFSTLNLRQKYFRTRMKMINEIQRKNDSVKIVWQFSNSKYSTLQSSPTSMMPEITLFPLPLNIAVLLCRYASNSEHCYANTRGSDAGVSVQDKATLTTDIGCCYQLRIVWIHSTGPSLVIGLPGLDVRISGRVDVNMPSSKVYLCKWIHV